MALPLLTYAQASIKSLTPKLLISILSFMSPKEYVYWYTRVQKGVRSWVENSMLSPEWFQGRVWIFQVESQNCWTILK
jgi:hypothetical protein